jgi:hypothetical protein
MIFIFNLPEVSIRNFTEKPPTYPLNFPSLHQQLNLIQPHSPNAQRKYPAFTYNFPRISSNSINHSFTEIHIAFQNSSAVKLFAFSCINQRFSIHLGDFCLPKQQQPSSGHQQVIGTAHKSHESPDSHFSTLSSTKYHNMSNFFPSHKVPFHSTNFVRVCQASIITSNRIKFTRLLNAFATDFMNN